MASSALWARRKHSNWDQHQCAIGRAVLDVGHLLTAKSLDNEELAEVSARLQELSARLHLVSVGAFSEEDASECALADARDGWPAA